MVYWSAGVLAFFQHSITPLLLVPESGNGCVKICFIGILAPFNYIWTWFSNTSPLKKRRTF
jgi:hypothetical protein